MTKRNTNMIQQLLTSMFTSMPRFSVNAGIFCIFMIITGCGSKKDEDPAPPSGPLQWQAVEKYTLTSQNADDNIGSDDFAKLVNSVSQSLDAQKIDINDQGIGFLYGTGGIMVIIDAREPSRLGALSWISSPKQINTFSLGSNLIYGFQSVKGLSILNMTNPLKPQWENPSRDSPSSAGTSGGNWQKRAFTDAAVPGGGLNLREASNSGQGSLWVSGQFFNLMYIEFTDTFEPKVWDLQMPTINHQVEGFLFLSDEKVLLNHYSDGLSLLKIDKTSFKEFENNLTTIHPEKIQASLEGSYSFDGKIKEILQVDGVNYAVTQKGDVYQIGFQDGGGEGTEISMSLKALSGLENASVLEARQAGNYIAVLMSKREFGSRSTQLIVFAPSRDFEVVARVKTVRNARSFSVYENALYLLEEDYSVGIFNLNAIGAYLNAVDEASASEQEAG